MALEDGDHDREMRSHWWWRPGWHLGRKTYTFHVTFDDRRALDGIDDLRRQVTEYQERLERCAGLDPIPLQWLHLTTQGVGFTDEVSEEDLRRILEFCSERLQTLDSFALEFSRCLVTSEGVLLLAEPSEPVIAVRDEIRSAICDVVDSMRSTPARVTVGAISLIMLDRDERVYRWRTYATVPLDSWRGEPRITTAL